MQPEVDALQGRRRSRTAPPRPEPAAAVGEAESVHVQQRRRARGRRGGCGPGQVERSGQQGAGVAGRRGCEDVGDRALLDEPSALHDEHPVAHPRHDIEVMGHQHQGRASLCLEAQHEIEDLGFRRLVERRGRLVEHQQLGLAGERRRDHDALALAAGDLVGIAPRNPGRIGQAHLGQQVERPGARCGPTKAGAAAQHLLDLPADGDVVGERGERVLRHHGDPQPAQGCQGRPARARDFEAVDRQRAAVKRAAAAQIAEQGAGQRRLAGAGFADDAERPLAGNVKADTVDDTRQAAARHRIADGQVACGDQRASGRRAHGLPPVRARRRRPPWRS